MSLSFFNIKSNPFDNSPTPDRLFLSRSHLRGRQELAYSIEGRKGLITVLAPRGMGKATLMRAYIEQRQQRNIRALWLSGASGAFASILEQLCAPRRIPTHGQRNVILRELRAALMREAEAGYRTVLILEAAESLSNGALEELLALTDMENSSGKLLTVILMGDPALEPRLQWACSQTFRPIKHRRINLEPLQLQESIAYVRHCIAQSSADGDPLLTPGALRAVARYAQGNPGLLNYVCSEVLRAALIAQQKPITRAIVRSVLNDLEGHRRRFSWRWSVAVGAGVLAIAGMSMGAPRLDRLWPQPRLMSVVTDFASKVKALPSLAPWKDASTDADAPLPGNTANKAQLAPISPPEPQDASPAPVEPKALTARAEPAAPPPLATPAPPPAPETIAAPEPALIAQASLLCLTERAPGNRARDIILVDHRDEVQQRLVSDGALNLSPILSPDQRYLAYTSYRGGRPSLYLRDLQKAKDQRLAVRADMALPGAWSADGRYLALSLSENGNSDIFVHDVRQHYMWRLTRDPGIDISPSFAPDGKRLAFTSNRSGASQLYLAHVDGRAPQRLTREGHYNAAPAWSPQGGWIAFIGRAPDQALELYVIRDDGSGLQQLTHAGGILEEAPTWSPDGQAILYTRLHHGARQRRIVTRDGGHDQAWPGHGRVCYATQWVARAAN